jgi:hypothetical protein
LIIYDSEIKKAIPEEGFARIEDVDYCAGWQDFPNMGIAVIGAYDYATAEYRVFLDDNLGEFHALAGQTDVVIGFNNWQFDDQLCAANAILIPEEKSYDLLAEIWRAAGLSTNYHKSDHSGRGLQAMSLANGGPSKTGQGALAPVDWQQGKYGKVIDYCLHDVYLTKRLVDLVLRNGSLVDPRAPDQRLSVASPIRWLANGALR